MKKVILLMVPALMLATIAMAQCPGSGPGNITIEKRIEAGMPGMMGEGRGMDRGMGRGQWWDDPVVAKEIGLTDEQSKKIDAMSTAHRKEMIRLEADLKIAKMELNDLFDNMEKETLIRKKVQEVSKLKEKIYTARIEHRLSTHKVLTAEQQKKMKSLRPMQRKRIIIKDNSED